MISGATIRDFSSKDQKFCFEIISVGKKAKKYSFCVDSEPTRKKWIAQLKKAASFVNPNESNDNPMGRSDSEASTSTINPEVLID